MSNDFLGALQSLINHFEHKHGCVVDCTLTITNPFNGDSKSVYVYEHVTTGEFVIAESKPQENNHESRR